MNKLYRIPLSLLLAFSFLAPVSAQENEFDPEDFKVIKSARPDGRYMSTRGVVQHHMRSLKPGLAFDETFSKRELQEWKTRVRTKLEELMAFPTVSEQPSPKRISSEERDGYTLEKWEIYPQPGSVVPILMLVPDGTSSGNPGPAVLCYPGSNRSKENLAGEPELEPNYAVPRHAEKNHMAKFYAQNGILAIAIDNPGVAEVSDLERFGSAPNFERNTMSRYLIDMGWHYMGFSSFNGNQILNWMRGLNLIDRNRIALSGHSLGTEPVMMLAVLNPDIKAIVFNDFLSNSLRRSISETKPDSKGLRPVANWLGHSVPGIWKWFDYADLLASLAPRSLIITEGGVTLDLHAVRKAYEISGAKKNFVFTYYEKYRKDRLTEGSIPEGLSKEEFFKFANVDAPNHYFKSEIAVPWLKEALKK